MSRAPNSLYFSNTCAKYSRLISEFVVFLEHVCKVQPLELRIRGVSRTRVQSAAVRAPNSQYSSNTCAKCSRSSSEFVVFLEHVCEVQPPDLRIRRISRTRVQSAAAGSLNSLYFANTFAKCSRWMSEFVVFFEHVCKVQPLDLRIRCISRTRVQSAASQQARQIEVVDFRNSGLGSRSFNT